MGDVPVKWRLGMADASIDVFSSPAYIGMTPENGGTVRGIPGK